MPQAGFLAVLVIELHFPEAGSLKSKRKDLASIKSLLHGRFGATVAEIEHQDLWQRSTLLAALASPAAAVLEDSMYKVERWLIERCPSGVHIERIVASLGDVRDAFPARFSIGG
jgi:uncharacterized protein YlxP (DUF503 family)